MCKFIDRTAKRVIKMGRKKCSDTCPYYDKETGFCGFCMKAVLKELEEKRSGKTDGDRQNNHESDE